MANAEYIERLKTVIRQLHGVESHHVASAPVEDKFCGHTVWKGIVEVFILADHPKAKRAYAWSHSSGRNDADQRFIAVLEIPPVASPETAVTFAVTSALDAHLICLIEPRPQNAANER